MGIGITDLAQNLETVFGLYKQPQGFWGEGLFIFRELGSTGNYFRGAGEQTHTF